MSDESWDRKISQIASLREVPIGRFDDIIEHWEVSTERVAKDSLKNRRGVKQYPNNGFNRLDDAKTRLEYVEKEFEQLKHDYYDLNIKNKELLGASTVLETENQRLHTALIGLQRESLHSKEQFESEQERLVQEIEQLNGLIEHQKQQLLSIPPPSESQSEQLKAELASLQTRIIEYENDITKYEGFRVKVESNLQKPHATAR